MAPAIEFPEPFLAFLKDNNLSLDEYAFEVLPRYIRVKPQLAASLDMNVVEAELGTPLTKVDWLDGFYRLRGDVNIANSALFKGGSFYGICVSSGVAVHALDVAPDDHVLDLCCAPGMKLCYVADLQGSDGRGTVTGVDLSPDRIAVCKGLLKKYRLERARLFIADGANFDVYAPSKLGKSAAPSLLSSGSANRSHESVIDDAIDVDVDRVSLPTSSQSSTVHCIPSRTEATTGSKTKPFHATRLIRHDPQLKLPSLLYDKVLVDAECTHDGSIVHLLKKAILGWSDIEQNLLSPSRLETLEGLQRGLISNGYRLLKPGGILVYSTCSFAKKQNEDIVAWFLERHPDAQLEPIPGVDKFPLARSLVNDYPEMDLSYAIRFSPVASRTSGLFIARIRKGK
ncbi:hypothetical protein SpCBS45565_g04535 [Spizellomyces sp. 'palustris']|nr:hypothetical protein SpCBS45565_g04535 [Spizellomyces sp. 'palustris']